MTVDMQQLGQQAKQAALALRKIDTETKKPSLISDCGCD